VKKIGLIRHLCSIIHYAGVLKADLPEESHQKPYQCPMCYKPNRDISTLLRHYGGTESKLLELGCVGWHVLEDRPRKKAKQALILPPPTMGYQQRERWLQVRAAKKPEKRKGDRSMELYREELAHTMTGRIKVKPRHLNIVAYLTYLGEGEDQAKGGGGGDQGHGKGEGGGDRGLEWCGSGGCGDPGHHHFGLGGLSSKLFSAVLDR
jgi:hypothetical protein